MFDRTTFVALLAWAGAASAATLPESTFAAEAAPTEAVIHEEVQAALNWQLPEHDCQQPKLKGKGTDIVDDQGATRRYDIDSYQLARFERKQKRWNTCIRKYKQGLIDDFATLKDSAQYGLTEEQAHTILSKMALIQTVIESPTASVDDPPPES